jgi:hypothetical protein
MERFAPRRETFVALPPFIRAFRFITIAEHFSRKMKEV